MIRGKESDESRCWTSSLNERGRGLFLHDYRCRCHRQKLIAAKVHEQTRMDLTLAHKSQVKRTSLKSIVEKMKGW
jgi:hypothetical protein